MPLSDKTRGWLQALPFGLLLFVLWPIIGLNKALPAAAVAVVFSVLLEHNWHLRRGRVFQAAVGILLIIHLIAIWLIPFGRARMGAVAVPFAFLDYFALSGLLRWIEGRFGGTSNLG